jgi:flagellar protein FlgJ
VVRTVERFRSYGSYTEAFHDFGKLLTRSGSYAGAVSSAADPVAYAKELQRGGYATDPHYADKLVRAIRMVTSAAPSAPAQVIAGAAVKSPDRA